MLIHHGGQYASPPPSYASAASPANHGVRCYCGAPMVRRPSWRIDHQGNPKPDYWGCVARGCDGSVGAHADGRPLGTATDRAGRKARRAAHAVLDRLWLGRRFGLTRHDVYGLVQYVMDLPEERAHVGMMDATQCRRLIAALIGLYPELAHTDPTAAEGRIAC